MPYSDNLVKTQDRLPIFPARPCRRAYTCWHLLDIFAAKES